MSIVEKSIESIWINGFANKALSLPKVNTLYNQKSINIVDKTILEFKWEVFILIPITALVFAFNIWLDNDNAFFWGLISSAPSLFWFVLGSAQLKSLTKLDYQSSSYEYLVSIRAKLISIRKFNKRLAITTVPILLLPLLVYTYYNQAGKTLGEIVGVEGLNYPTSSIFWLLPVAVIVVLAIAELHFRVTVPKTTAAIDQLIEDIEVLIE